MAQYLGGAPSGAVCMSVKNLHASNAIERGRIVSLYPDADASYATHGSVKIGQGYGAGFGFVIAVQPWVTSTADIPVGVALQRIPAGEEGTVVVIGPTMIETTGSVVAGNSLGITTGGKALTYASGDRIGKALVTDDTWTSTLFGGELDGPTATTATYVLAFVSFVTTAIDA